MTHNIHHKTDRTQPQIHEGESAHYRDALHWRKEITFLSNNQPASKQIDFANLTALVETQARARFPKFDTFSKAKRKKICEEIAHSAINRPDIREIAHLEEKLLEDLGISSKIEYELCQLLPAGAELSVSSAQELRDFFLGNYHLPPEELRQKLKTKLQELNWTYESPIELLLICQKRLIKIFTTKQIYLRNNTEFANKTFLDDFGRLITLTLPIASSKDRSNPHLQNARAITSGEKFVAVTGRPDTIEKAIEQAELLIRNGQAQNGHLYYVVNSYINVHFEEKMKMFQNEVDTLKTLDGATIEVDGNSYTLHPILFNAQLTMKPLEPFAPYDISGKQKSQKVQRENFIKFKELIDSLKTPENTPLIDSMMAKLNHTSSLRAEEEILLRAAVCELLNIPSVHHCASSKDRTTIGLAIAGALHKWLELQAFLGKDSFPKNDPLLLWKNEAFKHLVAQELPGCHQLSRNGLGTRGTIYGKQLHDDSVGFKLGSDILSRILPMLYLKEASLPKKALMFLAAVGAWLLCTTVALLRLIIFPIALYNPKAALYSFLNIFRIHRFASLIPDKELNPESPYVKERHLIEKKSATQPRFLLDLEKMPDMEILIQEMAKANPIITKKEHREALVLIANNWDRFNKLKTSKQLQKLIKLCDKSNLTLFRLRSLYTAEFVSQIKKQYHPESTSDLLLREKEIRPIEENGIYNQIKLDVASRGKNVFFEVVHNGKRTRILGEEGKAQEVIETLAGFPFSENGTVPIPIQALLTQTGQGSSYIPCHLALQAISTNLMLEQGSDMWEVSLHVLDDNTVQAKYRAPYEIQKLADENHQIMSLLSLDFSITLKKQADGNWTETSATMDNIRLQFKADHDFLFTSDEITKTQAKIIDEFRKGEAAAQTAHLASFVLEVLEKKPSVFKPKLIAELKHLKLLSPVRFEKFVSREKLELKTNLFGRITNVNKLPV